MIPLEEIRQAAQRLDGHIKKTPLYQSSTLSRMYGGQVHLKLENLQKTGSFKIRGATNKLLARRGGIGSQGVVAASAGNHAQGVALAARQAGLPATIVMPAWVSITKQEATRGYGGQVLVHGDSVEESLDRALELAAGGRTFIHPFDDADIIAGQGTVALEILADLPEADALVVPVGGGGLIAGIAAVARRMRPAIRIVGVETAGCASGAAALREGRPTRVAARNSIADGIVVRRIGTAPCEHIREGVDEMVAVEEDQIARAMLFLLERKKILVEGAGAVPLAALMAGAVRLRADERAVLVLSGGNVDSPLIGRIIAKGLIESGRMMRVRVELADKPGELARLLVRVSALNANVMHIRHERHRRDMPLERTRVELELETRGSGHAERIRQELLGAGYEPEAECPLPPAAP